MTWYVYCLQTLDLPFVTYVGATVDLDRRLAQHNGVLKGGAKATGRRPQSWRRVCHVAGFADNHQALSFEWHWKHFTRKSPTRNREEGLEACLEWASVAFPTTVLEVKYE